MLQQQLRPGDHYNSLLGFPGFFSAHEATQLTKNITLGLNPHDNSPMEALHTFSLGQCKYLWTDTTSKWGEEKGEKFIAWLGASNVDGLGVTRGVQARNLVNYKGSLVGKHFKWISQLTAFNLHWGGCNPIILDLWKATGELGALIWCQKILDMDQYTVQLIDPSQLWQN